MTLILENHRWNNIENSKKWPWGETKHELQNSSLQTKGSFPRIPFYICESNEDIEVNKVNETP